MYFNRAEFLQVFLVFMFCVQINSMTCCFPPSFQWLAKNMDKKVEKLALPNGPGSVGTDIILFL